MTPFQTKNGESVPCGKCPDCRARRVSGWSFRLMEEEKRSSSALFLTLTYDPMKVPMSPKGFMTLNKRDCQLFMKKLRKDNANKLKYYLVGEYGGRTKRPHYHIILFNADIQTIQPAWGTGHIHYGTVSGASVGYTLKYMSKPKTIPQHKNDDRLPEFSLMSKGLGLSYLTAAIERWHKSDLDNRMYCNLPGNVKISMPRYYKNKLYDEKERQIVAAANALRIANSLGETPSHPEWLNRKAGIKAAYEKQRKPDTKSVV